MHNVVVPVCVARHVYPDVPRAQHLAQLRTQHLAQLRTKWFDGYNICHKTCF